MIVRAVAYKVQISDKIPILVHWHTDSADAADFMWIFLTPEVGVAPAGREECRDWRTDSADAADFKKTALYYDNGRCISMLSLLISLIKSSPS